MENEVGFVVVRIAADIAKNAALRAGVRRVAGSDVF
jgi:hypothetical protein